LKRKPLTPTDLLKINKTNLRIALLSTYFHIIESYIYIYIYIYMYMYEWMNDLLIIIGIYLLFIIF